MGVLRLGINTLSIRYELNEIKYKWVAYELFLKNTAPNKLPWKYFF